MSNAPAVVPPFFRIALDVGFHSFKVSAVYAGKLYTFTMPSVVGVGETSLGLLQTGISRQKRNLPFLVTFDNQSYLVGPYVSLYARPIERVDFDRLSYCLELRVLMYAALSGLLSQITRDGHFVLKEPVDMGLILALPVQVLQSANSKQVIQALESWLIGSHVFELDNSPCRFNIHLIKAMAQPLGSFFEWGLNLNGYWQRASSDLKASIGIFDQGFNTTDLFHIHQGQIVKRFTGGETLGQRRAARLMQELLEQRTGRKVTLYEADEYLRQSANGHPVEVVVRGDKFDLKPLARQALDVAAGELRAYLSQMWEDGKQFDYILMTGGGALALGNRLQSAFSQVVELSDPVTANARGMARFAQRKGVLDFALNQVA